MIATMVSFGKVMQGATSGFVWANPNFTVTAGSQYAQFVANYGYPAFAPGKWGPQYGINAAGKPYVACTTCHNQHVMTVYTSSTPSRSWEHGGFFTTFFFMNGPYNPNSDLSNANAPSTTPFCRQCHFAEANEANNTNGITTVFQ